MSPFGGMEVLVVDAQQQRRTPIVGHYYAHRQRQWTRKRRQGRKCSRRAWKARNRKQWAAVPIYAEPTDVVMLNGRAIVTPLQMQALKAAIRKENERGMKP